MTSAQTAVHCEAKTAAYDRTMTVPPYCRREIALGSFIDRQGVRRYHCQSVGHRGNVVRQFGLAEPPEQADPITAAKGREWIQDHGGYALVIDEAPE